MTENCNDKKETWKGDIIKYINKQDEKIAYVPEKGLETAM